MKSRYDASRKNQGWVDILREARPNDEQSSHIRFRTPPADSKSTYPEGLWTKLRFNGGAFGDHRQEFKGNPEILTKSRWFVRLTASDRKVLRT